MDFGVSLALEMNHSAQPNEAYRPEFSSARLSRNRHFQIKGHLVINLNDRCAVDDLGQNSMATIADEKLMESSKLVNVASYFPAGIVR
jgi:hypothetical protein